MLPPMARRADTRFFTDAATGLVAPARQCPSPNQDPRPAGCGLELIVIHSISLPPGQFGGPHIEDFFSNRLRPDLHPYFSEIAAMEVSAHALIRRDGTLVQFVPFVRRAWHAGASTWCGRERCNDFSIGIELEGTDDIAYDERQYEALAGLIHSLRRAYPTLETADVLGHSDIAPGRKTDPGETFDWDRLGALLAPGIG
jgi:AmpD protein